MTSDAALRASGIWARIGELEVLRGIDLEVRAGSVVGLLGPSGAGKSTLFRALAGEIAPSRGEVFIAEKEVSRWPLWRRARAGLGYVPQTPSVLLDLSVADNIESFQRAARSRRRDGRELAERAGLADRLEVRAGELSGGERRRLEILRALVGEPRVLLCDEPFAALDPAGAALVSGLLRELSQNGAAVILADHRVRDALEICDEAVLLVDGRIAVRAPADRFALEEAVRERYLG